MLRLAQDHRPWHAAMPRRSRTPCRTEWRRSSGTPRNRTSGFPRIGSCPGARPRDSVRDNEGFPCSYRGLRGSGYGQALVVRCGFNGPGGGSALPNRLQPCLVFLPDFVGWYRFYGIAREAAQDDGGHRGDAGNDHQPPDVPDQSESEQQTEDTDHRAQRTVLWELDVFILVGFLVGR